MSYLYLLYPKKGGCSRGIFVLIWRQMRFEPDKYLHSKEHLLADDLSRMLGETKKFAAYLGIAKLYHESDLRGLARRVLEKGDLPSEARGKYFFAALRGLIKKSGVKFKRKKKEKKNGKNNSHRKNSRKSSKKEGQRSWPERNPKS